MSKKIVIALGGNALGNNLPEQMEAVKNTAKAIADLIEEGNEVVISHGNGPQVGMINLAMGELAKADPGNPVAPLSVCVAMSQGYIGYDLQNALREELLDRGIHKPVSSIITQMRVDPDDEAFSHPTKPIGRFMTKEEIMMSWRMRAVVTGGLWPHQSQSRLLRLKPLKLWQMRGRLLWRLVAGESLFMLREII